MAQNTQDVAVALADGAVRKPSPPPLQDGTVTPRVPAASTPADERARQLRNQGMRIAQELIEFMHQRYPDLPDHEVLEGLWLAFQGAYGISSAKDALRYYGLSFDTK